MIKMYCFGTQLRPVNNEYFYLEPNHTCTVKNPAYSELYEELIINSYNFNIIYVCNTHCKISCNIPRLKRLTKQILNIIVLSILITNPRIPKKYNKHNTSQFMY